MSKCACVCMEIHIDVYRVKVVQLNCYYEPINWKYPFLTSPERGLQSDSCI